jgi:hypothetical protein
MQRASRMAAVAVLATVSLSGCGTSTPSDRSSVQVSPDAAPTSQTDESTPLGYELDAQSYTPVFVGARRPPTVIPANVDAAVYVFRAPDNALLVIRSEPNESSTADTISKTITGEDGDRRVAIETAGTTYIVTQSNSRDSANVQDDVVGALTRADGSSIEAAVLEALPTYKQTGSTSGPALAEPGYGVNYSNGVSLAVYPVQPGAELAAIDNVATDFVQRANGAEWVVTHGFEVDPPQVHWIEGNHLLILTGLQAESLRDSVVPITVEPVQYISERINDELSQSALVGKATVGTVELAKRSAFGDGQEAVCLTESEAKTECAQFFAVNSLASVSVSGDWYIAAVVPAQEPTTTYRTDPPLKFDSTTSDGWSWALALVPKGVDDVTVFYGTAGVETDLTSTLQRPS